MDSERLSLFVAGEPIVVEKDTSQENGHIEVIVL